MHNDSASIPPESTNHVTRRQLLRGIAVGAAAVTAHRWLSGIARGADLIAMPPQEGKITRALPPAVVPFPLSDVRLLEGPFLAAQKRDEKYLLSLEPDRLLHNFRTNAGLEAKAPVYGGWESVQPWIDIRCHGHTLGHYLSACAMMFASTANPVFKQRCDYIIAELQACQTAGKTGLICAFPDGAAPFEAIAAGRTFPGVIWYTMHKIFAGLRDAHLFASSPGALDVLAQLADSALDTTKNLTDAQFQRMLGVEHGGMNEVLADTYVLTGQTKYLDLAKRFCHHQVMDPLAQGRDTLASLHSNTQIPKFIGFQRLHELTGEAPYHAAAQFFWQTVTRTRSFATGGNGDNEHFFPIADFARHLSAKTMETCCSHNMLRLTRALFTLDPSAEYADYYEKTLFNAILASQDPDSGMMTYFQPLKPGYVKIYCTPTDSFWCCTGTGIENHAKYGDSIYFHTADALYVNQFLASTVEWKEKALTLTQKTSFPDSSHTTLIITAKEPVELTLKVRHPSWCKTMSVGVGWARNAQASSINRTYNNPGTYVEFKRTWQTGDFLEIDLPMTARAELLPGTTDTLALAYGPIVLAGKLGTQGIAPNSDIVVNERLIGTMLNNPITVPALQGDAASLPAALKPVPNQPLTFTAPTTAADAAPVTLAPFFRIAHEHYTVYWKFAPA